MECLEIGEIIDQFGWAAEVCMTIFGGKEGFFVIFAIKLVGAILDFAAFITSASENAKCDSYEFGSEKWDENNCIFSDIYVFSILYIVFQRGGAIFLICWAIKPWIRLNNGTQNNNGQNIIDTDNGTGKNIRELMEQNPQTKEERRESTAANMLFGAQWNILDAYSKQYLVSMSAEFDDPDKKSNKKPKINRQLSPQRQASIPVKDKEDDEQDQDQPNNHQTDKIKPSEDAVNSNSDGTANVEIAVEAPPENQSDENQASANGVNPKDDHDASVVVPNTTDVAIAKGTDNTNNDETSKGDGDYSSKDNAVEKNKQDDVNGATNTIEPAVVKKEDESDTLGECSPQVKKYACIYSILLVLDILFWFYITVASLSAFTYDNFDSNKIDFFEVFPMLWIVVNGYYGHVEHYLILILAPVQTTTLGQNQTHKYFFYILFGVLFVTQTILTLVIFFSILDFVVFVNET